MGQMKDLELLFRYAYELEDMTDKALDEIKNKGAYEEYVEWKKRQDEQKEEKRMNKKKQFDEIGKVITENIPGFEKIFLERVGFDEFIVVQFEGGGISVRNATGNSTIANVAELAKLLNGGYYDEVEYYKKRKEQQNEKK